MPCERLGNGFGCSNTIKKVDRYIVEFPPIGCPVALKADGSIYGRIPGGIDRFYRIVKQYLTKENQ